MTLPTGYDVELLEAEFEGIEMIEPFGTSRTAHRRKFTNSKIFSKPKTAYMRQNKTRRRGRLGK